MNARRKLKRIARFVVPVAILVALVAAWYFYLGPGRVVSVSRLADAPANYDGEIVRFHVADVRSGDPIPGYNAVRVIDGAGGAAVVVPNEADVNRDSTIAVRVHHVELSGRQRIVLEQVSLNRQQAWQQVLRTFGIGQPSAQPAESSEGARMAATVTEETELLGDPCFVARTDSDEEILVVSKLLPPVGADVHVQARDIQGLAFLAEELQFYEAFDVCVDLSSVTSSPHIFGDRQITVEGRVKKAVAALGQTAFTIGDNGAPQLIVVTGKDAPPAGTMLKASGRVEHLTVFGKTLLLCLVANDVQLKPDAGADEIVPDEPQSTAPESTEAGC